MTFTQGQKVEFKSIEEIETIMEASGLMYMMLSHIKEELSNGKKLTVHRFEEEKWWCGEGKEELGMGTTLIEDRNHRYPSVILRPVNSQTRT